MAAARRPQLGTTSARWDDATAEPAFTSVIALDKHSAHALWHFRQIVQFSARIRLSVCACGRICRREVVTKAQKQRTMTEDIHRIGLNFTRLTAEIVSAYVIKNSVPVADLPKLLESIHTALCALQANRTTSIADPVIERPTPAQIRKSVRDDGLVSFLDGKTYKTLKRHLTKHGLDPQSYRERYGLPSDYPMTAPSYAEQRSRLAMAIGLGRPGSQAGRKRGSQKAA